MKRFMIVSVCCLLTHAGCQSTDRFAWSDPSPSARSESSDTSTPPGLPTPTQKVSSSNESKGQPTVDLLLAEGQMELESWERDNKPYHLAKARMNFEEIVRQDPRHARAHHGLAIIADLEHDYSTAEHHYQSALAQNPSDSDVLGDLGYSYLLQNRLADAEKYLLPAIEANPNNSHATKHLGDVYARQGRTESANQMYSKVMTPNEVEKALAENSGKGRTTDSKSQLVAESVSSATEIDETESIFERLMPKKNNAEELTADIQRRLKEQRSAEANSRPRSQKNEAWTGNVAAANRSDEHDQLRRELAAIDQEKYQRTFDGPVMVDHTTGALEPLPNRRVTPAWAADSNTTASPAGFETPGDGRESNSGPWHGDVSNSQAQTSPMPSTQTGSSAPQTAWSGQDPSALIQRQPHQTAYQGSTPAQRSMIPPDLSPMPPGVQPLRPGNPGGSMNQLNSGGADQMSAASKSAARMGMGLGPGSMFPTVSGAASVNSAGTNSQWNGDAFPQPNRVLPTDLTPPDLKQAYQPMPNTTPSPGSSIGSPSASTIAPSYSQQQFGTASRYDAQTLQGSGVPAPAHMDSRLQDFELQRQASTRDLNNAVQQVWGNGQMNNMVSPAAGTTYTPPPMEGQTNYPMSRPADFGSVPAGVSGPRTNLSSPTQALRPINNQGNNFVEPPPYQPQQRTQGTTSPTVSPANSQRSPYFGGNGYSQDQSQQPAQSRSRTVQGMPMIVPSN